MRYTLCPATKGDFHMANRTHIDALNAVLADYFAL